MFIFQPVTFVYLYLMASFNCILFNVALGRTSSPILTGTCDTEHLWQGASLCLSCLRTEPSPFSVIFAVCSFADAPFLRLRKFLFIPSFSKNLIMSVHLILHTSLSSPEELFSFKYSGIGKFLLCSLEAFYFLQFSLLPQLSNVYINVTF